MSDLSELRGIPALLSAIGFVVVLVGGVFVLIWVGLKLSEISDIKADLKKLMNHCMADKQPGNKDE